MRNSLLIKHESDYFGFDPKDYHARMARVRAYQQALTMADWTLFAPLEFRRWAGQATHFRDAERSAKVEGDGDPLGLVDPLVGAPLVQTVSAERPVWTEEGASGAGVESLLIDKGSVAGISQSLAPDNSGEAGTLVLSYDQKGNVDNCSIFGFVNDGATTYISLRLNSNGAGSGTWRTRDDSGVMRDISFFDPGLLANGRVVLSVVKDPIDSALRVYVNGESVRTANDYSSPNSVSPPQYDPALMARNLRGVASDHYTGVLSLAGWTNSALPPATIAKISDLLL